MANKNDKLVLAYYANIPTATGAAQELMAWDEADDDVKLGAIAIVSYDPRSDELVTTEIGQRNTRKGALWGTAIGATLGLLTGGIALIPGLLIGATAGAAIGATDRDDVVMTDGQMAELLERTRHGAGAVAVMADDFEVGPVKAFLARLGGDVDDFTLPQETAEAVTTAAAVQAAAAAAVDESVFDERVELVETDQPDMTPEKAEVVSTLSTLGSISAANAALLHDAGVDKASRLLAQGSTPEGRAELSAVSGLSEETVLLIIKELDLMRVKGIGPKYASLLVASGVASVPDLARRNGENLAVKLADVNESAELVADLPSAEEVSDWVAQAEELPRVVYY
jgi:predicted flap endonuclease-1-like 5' DNA nuclease